VVGGVAVVNRTDWHHSAGSPCPLLVMAVLGACAGLYCVFAALGNSICESLARVASI